MGLIGCMSQTFLVCFVCVLNSGRYISVVLSSVALPFIRVLRNATFPQNNPRPHVAGIVRTFLDRENVRLLPWAARSPDLSSTENFWSMIATSIPTVDELWPFIQAA